MSVARFKVVARLDMASRETAGTVTIDRSAGVFSVRPLRKRRGYMLPLTEVASMVCRAIIAAEARQQRAEKKAKRRAR